MSKFSISGVTLTAYTMGDELARIGRMIADGFTEGEVVGGGWWKVSDLDEEDDGED